CRGCMAAYARGLCLRGVFGRKRLRRGIYSCGGRMMPGAFEELVAVAVTPDEIAREAVNEAHNLGHCEGLREAWHILVAASQNGQSLTEAIQAVYWRWYEV